MFVFSQFIIHGFHTFYVHIRIPSQFQKQKQLFEIIFFLVSKLWLTVNVNNKTWKTSCQKEEKKQKKTKNKAWKTRDES